MIDEEQKVKCHQPLNALTSSNGSIVMEEEKNLYRRFVPSLIASIDLNLVVYVAKIGGEIDSRVIVTRA